MANGNCLFTKGLCKGFKWEVQDHKFENDFIVLSLKGCDMVLGVQWLLALGDIIWNFSSLKMQFNLAEESCVLQGIIPSSLAATNTECNLRCFAVIRELLGPYTAVLSSPEQVALSTKGDTS